MKQTIADMLREEGRVEGVKLGDINRLRRVLQQTLRTRFGELPRRTAATIDNCESLARLEEWFDKALTAQALDDIGISSRK
jgi:hypothetical protein